MTDYRTATRFVRFRRPLHVVLIDGLPWFCCRDLARLTNSRLDMRITAKLDADQWRLETLRHEAGQFTEELLVNESGLHALLLVNFYHPENSSLRQWITQEVLPALRDGQRAPDTQPRRHLLKWQGHHQLNLMEWQGQWWIRYDDMPRVLGQGDALKQQLS